MFDSAKGNAYRMLLIFSILCWSLDLLGPDVKSKLAL